MAIRQAEAHWRIGELQKAVSLLRGSIGEQNAEISPIVRAEADYCLGLIAREESSLLPERPLMYFRRALSMIESEHVSEISWKLSYALATEYARRGNREKALEYFLNSKVIIEYFAGKLFLGNFRDLYLASEGRNEVLEEVAAYAVER